MRGLAEHHLLRNLFNRFETVESAVALFGADALKQRFGERIVSLISVSAHFVVEKLEQNGVVQRRDLDRPQRRNVRQYCREPVERLFLKERNAEYEHIIILKIV